MRCEPTLPELLADRIGWLTSTLFRRLPERPRQAPRVARRSHPVLDALRRAGRPLFNRELAELMGCSAGEASKRRREVEHLLRTEKRGRRVYAALAC